LFISYKDTKIIGYLPLFLTFCYPKLRLLLATI